MNTEKPSIQKNCGYGGPPVSYTQSFDFRVLVPHVVQKSTVLGSPHKKSQNFQMALGCSHCVEGSSNKSRLRILKIGHFSLESSPES